MSAGLGVAFALLWVSGVFFGMGLERRLFERKNRNVQTSNTEDGAPYPLPVPKIEGNNSAHETGEARLDIYTAADEHNMAVGVVVGRRDIRAAVPNSELMADSRDDSHSEIPNV